MQLKPVHLERDVENIHQPREEYSVVLKAPKNRIPI